MSRHESLPAALCGLLAVLVFAGAAIAGSEMPICTASLDQYLPAVSGNIVVWEDTRDYLTTGYDIYGMDLSTETEFPICTAPEDQRAPDISGDIVVWVDLRNSSTAPDIYGKDLSTETEFAICTEEHMQYWPRISGDTVVWQDIRNSGGGWDIYGKYLSTETEFPICTAATTQYVPTISGTIVVWQDQRNFSTSSDDLYGKDLSGGDEFAICTAAGAQSAAAVSGSIVVWQDKRNSSTNGSDIYGNDLSGGGEFLVCGATGDQEAPAISDDIVVWADERTAGTTGSDIYAKDLLTGDEFAVCTQSDDQTDPAVSCNTVAWEDLRNAGTTLTDIYGYSLDRSYLSSGAVDPGSGDSSTAFTWRVNYRHTGDAAPTTVWAAIWSGATKTTTWQTMAASESGDTDYTDGKWYAYSSALAAGDYAYRYAARVGEEWRYWPEPAGTYCSGPTVTQANPAVLSSGYVMPSSGAHATSFTWRIKYWNTNDAAPDGVWCAVWFPSHGRAYWHPMWAYNPADTCYRDGAWYTFSRRWLPEGACAYRFAAHQGDDWAYWPSPTGSYASGPTVSP